MKRMQPMRGNVLLRPEAAKERTTEAGLIIPETTQQNTFLGEVLSVGAPRLLDDGKEVALDVAVGETVVYRDNAAIAVEVGNEQLVLLDARAIVGVLVDDGP